MKPNIVIAVFAALVISAVWTGADSYRTTEYRIDKDVNRALALALRGRQADRIDADTVYAYRSHINIAAVRDTAYIAMETRRRGRHLETVLRAHAGCGVQTVWAMSDQRASGSLAAMAVLWLTGSMVWMRRHRKDRADTVTFGGLSFCPATGRFSAGKTAVRFTPMQQQLMEMFFNEPTHELSKSEICNALWPKKPDATDTLYTLVKRLKPVVEGSSRLRIKSDRGRTYSLEEE